MTTNQGPMRIVRRVDDTGIPLLLARLLVGGLFAYLAVMKLAQPPEFLKQLLEYEVLRLAPPIPNVTAVVVPWLELLCALAVILGIFLRGAAVMLLGMLLLFLPLLVLRAWGLYTAPGSEFASFCDVKFDCGCGTGVVYICSKLAENTALKVGAVVILLSRSRWLCLENVLFGRRRAATAGVSRGEVASGARA